MDWDSLSPDDFERFVYSLLKALGFANVVWRRGPADKGRDIDCQRHVSEPDGLTRLEKWCVECKHETRPVSVERLYSKLAWADADRPDYLLIVTSGSLTNQAREWLGKVQSGRPYQMRIWDRNVLESIAAEQSVTHALFAETFPQSGIRHIALAKLRSFPTAQRYLTEEEAESLLHFEAAQLDAEIWMFAIKSLVASDFFNLDKNSFDDLLRSYLEVTDLEWLKELLFVGDVRTDDAWSKQVLLTDEAATEVIHYSVGHVASDALNFQLGYLLALCCRQQEQDWIKRLASSVDEISRHSENYQWNLRKRTLYAVAFGVGRVSARDGEHLLSQFLASTICEDTSLDSVLKYYTLGRLVGLASPVGDLEDVIAGKVTARTGYFLERSIEESLAKTIERFLASDDDQLRRTGVMILAGLDYSDAYISLSAALSKQGIACFADCTEAYLKAVTEHCSPADLDTVFGDAICHHDGRFRELAVSYLRAWECPTRVRTMLTPAVLLPLIADEDANTAATALEVLAQQKVSVPGDALHALLLDERCSVKKAAIVFVGALRLTEYRMELEAALQDDDPSIRQTALSCLARIDEAGGQEKAVDLLVDPDRNVRGQAVKLLSEIGLANCEIGKLEALLEDASSYEYVSWGDEGSLGHGWAASIGDDARAAIQKIVLRRRDRGSSDSGRINTG